MKFTINEIEYKIKSRHAIEILNIVEKSGLLESLKDLKGASIDSLPTILNKLPQFYKVAHDILSTALGTFSQGDLKKNDLVVDEMEAEEVPLYAIMIIKGLINPISYVLTDDKNMAEEKKSDMVESADTKVGTSESNKEPTV
jgi:hypothetical protein